VRFSKVLPNRGVAFSFRILMVGQFKPESGLDAAGHGVPASPKQLRDEWLHPSPGRFGEIV
jgi:hypothetical protein